MSATHDPLLLGIDIGTQSLRVAIVNPQGRTLAYHTTPFETTFPRPTWAEQNPLDWWHAAISSVTPALQKAHAHPDQIAAIGLDTTACTVVACDDSARPLRPALLWMDQRSAREADEISNTRDPALRFVSGRVSPEWMLPKALWLKRHEPETFRMSDRIVECTDWFMRKLTGHWTLALNHVAVKWNYVKPEGGWPTRLITQLGLDDLLAKWPETIVPLGAGQGILAPEAARELGLLPGTPVAQGGIDAYLGMIGLGATGDGDVAVIIGSSTCHLAQSRAPVLGSGAAGCYPDATVEGLYSIEAGQTATGSILDWYRRHLAGNEDAEARAQGVPIYEILDAKAAATPPGADGLLVRDDFQGNRSPYKNPAARGALVGLSLAHTPGHIIRAIYEATACGTRQILDDLVAHGMSLHRVVAGGGGVRSQLWMQIQANILDRPITLTQETESCALGAALSAAVRAGLYPDLDAAGKHMVQVDRVIEPQPHYHDLYQDLYLRYVNLYHRLNPAPA